MDINSFIEEITPYVIEKRREFHEHPEVAWTEYVTSYKIIKELEKLNCTIHFGNEIFVTEERIGLPSQTDISENEARAMEMGVPSSFIEKMKNGHTGVIAQFDTGKPGKHTAFRFDIDALPILEAEEENHIPFQQKFHSKRAGVMHSCAHDGHAAIGLGIAQFLYQFTDELTGRFTVIFQPAEEGGRGAKPIVAKGWLDDADYFISGHIGIQSYPVGTIAATANNFLASSKIDVTYLGKSAHAGLEPNKGRNALLAAASAALHLNGITRHADGATRINIGTLEAGSGRNIVADLAKMQLETRGATTELNEEYMVKEAIRIIKASANLFDVEEEITFVGSAPNATCDEEWIPLVKESSADSSLVTNVIDEMSMGASEDATYMMNRVREKGGLATYMVFCSPLPAGHHHPKFDFEEMVLPTAIDAISRLVLHINK
ncbi:amidohydrolase [Sutcliffiella cohnii]|uniref:amidohydrolase n=1 Tax=Sutcliffiella cohnii TaxID=33932 RepID=UPI002E1C5DE3|nr:amidohydrolase [Sutcliffiella cohnii]MED4014579.1 amidohydrolase [Sutcliffiella cohnii]